MIISLTGFMGCGKSSVGRELSKLLCCPFMDLDDVIVGSAGRSIPEIFASDGEAEFRRMERDALELVLNIQETRQSAPLAPSHFVGPSPYPGVGKCQFHTDALSTDREWKNTDHIHQANTPHDQADAERISAVLALGGGTVMTKECAKLVHEKTLCIYLRASVETLVSHLAAEADGRPMLRTSSKDRDSGTSLQESADTSSQEVKQESLSTKSLKNMRQNLQARIEELMSVRSATYESTAHIIINTDGKSVTEVAKEIMRRLSTDLNTTH